MHPTAMSNCQSFFDTYTTSFATKKKVKAIEIGSQNVNGSLRDTCPASFEYIGVDFQEANGVDIVLKDPYSLPFQDESVDIVLSSSCFEHSEMFWLVFLEVLRVLKPDGIFYLNAPSTGGFHRYPVDCWRFYPDSGMALVQWARVNGMKPVMLESYTQIAGGWQDYVCVFLKDEAFVDQFSNRILDHKKDFENGQLFNHAALLNPAYTSQNDTILQENETRLSNTVLHREHQTALAKLQSWHAETAAQASANQLQLEQQLALLKSSTSWRITAPLRWLKDMFN